jgi:hypothetical protein
MVIDLDERQTRVLLVIGTQSAIIRAPPLHRGVVCYGHFRRLQEDLSTTTVVVHVICNKHSLAPVDGTLF